MSPRSRAVGVLGMSPSSIGMVFLVSEVILRFARKSPDASSDATDRSTLRLLWLTITGSISLGVLAVFRLPFAHFSLGTHALWLCLAIFWLGLVLRWWAILSLGKFFTVDVAIQSDHRLVTHGLYRWIRHPSYTGMMVAFLGFTLTLRNWVSLLVVLIPTALALARRIRVEEAALTTAFGDEYRAYQKCTKRLVPGIY